MPVELTNHGRRAIDVAGPTLWAELHARPWNRPSGATDESELAWLDAFAARVPCGECRGHYRAWLATLTAADVSDAERYFAATWALHDSVNARLGKPRLTLTEAWSLRRA